MSASSCVPTAWPPSKRGSGSLCGGWSGVQAGEWQAVGRATHPRCTDVRNFRASRVGVHHAAPLHLGLGKVCGPAGRGPGGEAVQCEGDREGRRSSSGGARMLATAWQFVSRAGSTCSRAPPTNDVVTLFGAQEVVEQEDPGLGALRLRQGWQEAEAAVSFATCMPPASGRSLCTRCFALCNSPVPPSKGCGHRLQAA